MNSDILTRIQEAEDFPTLSAVSMKVMQMALDPDVSLKEFGEVMMLDVALSARVLKIVNSAYYGLPRQVTTVSQAVVILGVRVIRNIALSLSVLDAFPVDTGKAVYSGFWERALCSAVVAREVAGRARPKVKEEAFAAGLLEDIGTFLMARCLGDEYVAVLEEAENRGVGLSTAEEHLLGTDHARVGAVVAERWALPPSLLNSILYHHDPGKAHELGLPVATAEIAELAYLGGLAADIFYGWDKSRKITRFKEDVNAFFRIDVAAAEDILSSISDLTSQAASCFQIKIDAGRSYGEILQEANVELGRMNLKYDQLYHEMMAVAAELQLKNDRLARLTTELEDKNLRLQQLAERDGLTGVANHRRFQEFLTRQIVQAKRYGRALSLIMVDIDLFKSVNDTYGHQQGDAILRGLAKILAGSVRESDLVARYGGEEFAIVMAETSLKGAVVAAEKIRRVVEQCHFPRENGDPLRITISLGVASLGPGADSQVQLIEEADKALYQAKTRGRNRVCA